ncbi:hypothetical protein JL721_11402 [Aureococcus anophagefferens]|nr:hypothetical protein JL721_11402 [Aureococcus anophagefferens]
MVNFLNEELDEDFSPTMVFEHLSSLALRLPGDANSPEALWANLIAEKDAVLDDVPGDRPHNGRPSAYLSALTVRGFDRVAFGISAAEATAMDPQQRLVLECCAEALELGERRATPAPPGGDGEDVGVFAAIETSDYAYLHQRAVDEGAASTDAYCGTGWHGCVGPNRVSYLFDLRGPSVALNTACSSSLTCVSVARHSLDARVRRRWAPSSPRPTPTFPPRTPRPRATVAVIEAHGTGTRLGDPIELGALGGADLGAGATLRCASIKASIGHLEGCSGLAGLAKAALTLKHATAPRSLHFRTPNA